MKNNTKLIIFYVALIVIILIVISTLFNGVSKDKVAYSDLVNLFTEEQVKSFEVDNNDNVIIITQDNQRIAYKLRDFTVFYYDFGELILEQTRSGIIESYNYEEPQTIPWWVSLLPYVVLIGLFIALWVYMVRQSSGKGGKFNSFSKARAKLGSDEKKKVYFKDVAGAEEEKEDLREIVDFLRDPTKFTRLGARIPHGVLLVGPPGTGKTLLAKAVAGEAGVPFYSISGSDFVEMYVGVGASRVRDLFDTAKKHPASIVFIDEIDAVGRHRGAGLGGGHDEREQTLNQLLVEMDGFGTTDGVIVMAATNRPDILDPALLRPGRFDRQITVYYPDMRGREDILRVHSIGKPMENDVDLAAIAKTTVGFTGADLANLLNEAALLAARKSKSLIGMEDIEEALIKVVVGTPKKSKVILEKDKLITAFHEAGHAIVSKILQPDQSVRLISVIPSGQAAGYTINSPKEDRSHMARNDMLNEIATLLGGRVSESLMLEDVCTGASSDLKRATSIARSMVTTYGMSELLGPVVYGSGHSSDEVFLGRDFSNAPDYSDLTASRIDDEVKKIVDNAYATARRILTENLDKLKFIADYLMKNESMDEDQINSVMGGGASFEDLDRIAEDKRKKSEKENAERTKRDEEERIRREGERRRHEEDVRNGYSESGIDAYAGDVKKNNGDEDKK